MPPETMRLHYLSLLFIPLIPTLAYSAEVNEYDIEIVIFEDLSSRYVDSEQWPRLEHELLSELNYFQSIRSYMKTPC